MLKSELVQKLARANPHLCPRDIETIVNAIFSAITDALARGDRVELRGFGVFTVKRRGARQSRNPRTGQVVAVAGKNVPTFKTGKEIRQRLNLAGKNPTASVQRGNATSPLTFEARTTAGPG